MQEYNNTACNGNGDRECGVCVCNDGFYGKYCECSHRHDDKLCRRYDMKLYRLAC